MARPSAPSSRSRSHPHAVEAPAPAEGSRSVVPHAQGKDAKSSQLAREAKNQRSVLKEYLASASDKANSHGSLPSLTGPNSDLEFARKNLRNTYLNLLFSCTFTRHAHGVDSSLWIETTHPLVAIYRKHLSVLEKVVASLKDTAPAANAQGKRGGAAPGSTSNNNNSANNNAGHSANTRKQKLNEYSRVATEYRKFLLAEEVFWQELAARIVHTFQLHEAKPMFDALGIIYDPDSSTVTSNASNPASSGDVEASRTHTRAINDPDDIPRNAAGLAASTGMNRVQGTGTAAFQSSGASAAEAAAQVKAATIPSNRDRLIEIVHKAFICSGDLARYRIQITEKLGDGNKAAVATTAGSKPRKGATDYSRASAFYTQARRLLPDNGNPSNQLAVIATFMDDRIDAIHHYYRALCCRVPFETARQNLDSNLGHGVEKWARWMQDAYAAEAQAKHPNKSSSFRFERGWRPRRLRETVASMEADYTSAKQHDFLEMWMMEFVALHGLFHRKVYFTSLEALNQVVVARFALLVKNRALTPDLISKVVASGLSASWTTRLWRNTASGHGASSRRASHRHQSSAEKDRTASASNGKGKTAQRSDANDEQDDEDEDDEFLPASFNSEQRQAVHLSIENQLVAHVLEVMRTLMDVGTRETRSVLHGVRRSTVTAADEQSTRLPPVDQRVTATFRRVLPALRVAIKWVKGHLEYIQRCKDRALTSSQSSASDSMANSSLSFDHIPTAQESEVLLAKSRADGGVVESIFSFWRSLVDFINVLRYAFPWDDLPSLDTLGPLGAPALCLEEDLDMRGFSPTKKAMLPHASGGMGDACPAIGLSEALPHEEQLMRIADLLFDAKVVAESPTSPIIFDDERNAFMYAVPESEQMTSAALEQHDAIHAGFAQQQGAADAAREARAVKEDAGQPLNNTHQVQPQPGVLQGQQDVHAHTEASSEGFSESTEDVVDLAMRAVDNRTASLNDPAERAADRSVAMLEDDDEEDMILVPAVRDLWSHPSAGPKPVQQASAPAIPSAPLEFETRSRPQSQALGGPRTAQDLLLQVLNGSSPAASNANLQPLTSVSPLRNPQGVSIPQSTPGQHPPANANSYSLSSSPFSGSPVPQPLASAVSPSSTLLFGGMGASTSSPAGAHRGSIWSPGPMDMRAGPPHHNQNHNHHHHTPASNGSIWGPPGGAVPSPNFAAAQAFVNGGIFPAPPSSSGVGGTGGATPTPPPPSAQQAHNTNPFGGPPSSQGVPPGFGYGGGSGGGGDTQSSLGQAHFDDPFAHRGLMAYNPYPPSSSG